MFITLKEKYAKSYSDIEFGRPVRAWAKEYDGPKEGLGKENQDNRSYYLIKTPEGRTPRASDFSLATNHNVTRFFVDPELPLPDHLNPDTESIYKGWIGYRWVDAYRFDVVAFDSNEEALCLLRRLG